MIGGGLFTVPNPLPPPVARPASPGYLIWSSPASFPIDSGSLSASRQSLPVPSCRHGENQVAWLSQLLVQPYPDLPGSAFASTAAPMSASFVMRSLRSPRSEKPR